MKFSLVTGCWAMVFGLSALVAQAQPARAPAAGASGSTAPAVPTQGNSGSGNTGGTGNARSGDTGTGGGATGGGRTGTGGAGSGGAGTGAAGGTPTGGAGTTGAGGAGAAGGGTAGASGATTVGATSATSRVNDAQIASMLAIGNEEEVALGRFAQEKTENNEVKMFAKMMVDEHTEYLGQLQKFGAVVSREAATGAGSDNRGAGGGAPTSGATTGSVTAMAPSIGLNFLQVQRQIGERCIASTQKELNRKRGADMDKAYVGQQIVAHMQMLDKLAVTREYASPEFRKVIEMGMDTTQKHLDHAKDLMASLDKGGQAGGAHAAPKTGAAPRTGAARSE